MKTSLTICYNSQRISENGDATIYIRVLIDGRKKDFPLDIRWPAHKIDRKAGVCLPRRENDQECEDNNIIIRKEMSKCNEIIRHYRLADTQITLTRFTRDYKDNLSRKNFVDYMESKIKARYKHREIIGHTYQMHLVTMKKVRKFNAKLQFSDFDERWAQDFDNWLKRTIKAQKVKQSPNSRWSHHKVVKTYMNQAKRDHIQFTYPYDYFKSGEVRGNWSAIFEEDVKALYNYYIGAPESKEGKCPDNLRPILRAFLFGCMTGLRVSDLKRVTKHNVMDNILIFIPHKTRKSNFINKIPLNKMAKKMFDDASDESRHDELFGGYAEQYANRKLKDIAKLLKINRNLHWHVARHTFISLYYAKTKDLVATKEFAGHKSIKQTMVYTHQNPAEIVEKMKPMDDII